VARLETQLQDVNRTLTTIAEYLRGSRG
jgi:hypothetical protein